MAKLKLTIAYDGRAFSGWQSQPNSNTIQDILNAAISEVAKQPIQVQGSGRTDAGVHADGQVAHFESPTGVNMNPYNWVPALNTKLPPAIRVLDCIEMPDDFHARFSAKEKTYIYDLCLAPVLHPHRHGRAWHLPRQLDPLTLQNGTVNDWCSSTSCARSTQTRRPSRSIKSNRGSTLRQIPLLRTTRWINPIYGSI